MVTHEWREVPDKSFVDLGEGFLISTPEFCFLQMAVQLSLVRLIALGYELCGTYACVEGAPAQRREGRLMSVSQLATFLGRAADVRGSKKARRALRYLLDGSASPMETVLAMMFCLPYHMGGYGLPTPKLNYCVDVPSDHRKLADRSYCVCDLCWPELRLAVEYDSSLYHLDPGRQESDARRRSTLAALDYTVVTVSKGQVFDGGAFNRLAHQLAKLLGKRLRYVDPGFTRKHLALRDELFGVLLEERR